MNTRTKLKAKQNLKKTAQEIPKHNVKESTVDVAKPLISVTTIRDRMETQRVWILSPSPEDFPLLVNLPDSAL